MDSEERHELKENELAEFLSNFGEWWEKYGNVVLLVLVIAAGSFAGYRLYNHWTVTAHETAFGDLAATTSVEGYTMVADEHRNRTVQTLAHLRGADLALSQAREGAAIDHNADDASTGMSRDEALDRAEAMYRRALDLARQPVYRVTAHMGLAQVAENRNDWDQAANHYEQAGELAASAHLPTLASQARQRRMLLDQVQQPVVFARESDVESLPDLDPGTDFRFDGGDTQSGADSFDLFDNIDDSDAADTMQPEQPLMPTTPAEDE